MFPEVVHWPYLPAFERLSLALALGLFVGMERERRGKDAGLRTFGFVALTGALGGLLGDNYALLSVMLCGLLIVFLNLQTLRLNQGTELTTSIALAVTGLVGILSGKGHTLIPTAVGVITAALLAWKETLAVFSSKLVETEFRSAILLGILAFVIYPALPEGSIDPWGALEPRAAWVTIILIAGIGFVNYILWKIYGSRGIELTGFLGGLVNSSVTTRELAQRFEDTQGGIMEVAYRGILLAMAAMVIRNAGLLAILAPAALHASVMAFGFMLIAVGGLVLVRRKSSAVSTSAPEMPALSLKSPFSLSAALRFGIILIAIQVAGVIGQHFLGDLGVYLTSLLGGLFSSASAVAAAAALASHGTIPSEVAGTCAVIASLTSVVVNLPLVLGFGNRTLTIRLAQAVGVIAFAGVLGACAQALIWG